MAGSEPSRLQQAITRRKARRVLEPVPPEPVPTLLKGHAIREFVLAGDARFMITNPETGNSFEYRVNQKVNRDQSKTPHFVSVWGEPDPEHLYIGFIRNNYFNHGGRKAKLDADTLCVRAFSWFWQRIGNPSPIEFHHKGKCGHCAQLLTVRESIECGLCRTCRENLS